MPDVYRSILRIIAKFFVFIGICFTIFSVYVFFADGTVPWLPIIFGLGSLISWGILRRVLKQPKEEDDDTNISGDLMDIAGEIIDESVSMTVDVAIDTVSTVASGITEIDT